MIDTSQWVSSKAQSTPNQFLQGAMRVFDSDNKQGKERPFNYQAAINQYRGWMYAAIFLNAKAMATTPLKLYMRTKEKEPLYNAGRGMGKRAKNYIMGRLKRSPSAGVVNKAVEWGGEFEEVTEPHPLTILLKKPNPWMLGSEFAMMRSMMEQLTGNFYMHPVVESARFEGKSLSAIRELWIMPSQYVKVQPGEPTEKDFIRGYWFGVDETRRKFFGPDEVYHKKLPNPDNQWYGLGVMQAGWSVQMLSVAQRQTDQSRYDNHSRPDLAVITESMNGNIAQLKELQEEWSRLFRGTFRQGAPVFLTGKTQVIPLNWQPTEIGDREIIIEEIAAVTGVPVSLLKANDPNLASAQVGFASWRENTTLPYCRLDEEYLNNYLLPQFGLEEDAFLCYDDPVPENRDEVRQDSQMALTLGSITRNEWRAEMGYEPVEEENADTLLVPSGLQPIDKVGEMPAMGAGFAIGGNDDDGSSPKGIDSDDKKKETPDDVIQKFPAGFEWDEKTESFIRKKKLIVRQFDEVYSKGDQSNTVRDDESERLIRGLQLAVAKVFANQRRAVMACLGSHEKALDHSLLARVIAEVYNFTDDMAKAVAPFMDKILSVGVKAGLNEIDLPPDTFDVINPRTAEFMKQYSIKLAGEINGYTAQRLSETLAEGMEDGESGGQLSSRVGSLYEDFDGYRTEMIARTESARAYCAGSQQAWKESGVVEGKVWLLASGACAICKAIASKFGGEPIPLDQPFFPLGSVIPLPDGKIYKVDYSAIMAAPGHPHCRCGIKAVLKKVQE